MFILDATPIQLLFQGNATSSTEKLPLNVISAIVNPEIICVAAQISNWRHYHEDMHALPCGLDIFLIFLRQTQERHPRARP